MGEWQREEGQKGLEVIEKGMIVKCVVDREERVVEREKNVGTIEKSIVVVKGIDRRVQKCDRVGEKTEVGCKMRSSVGEKERAT